MIRQRSRQDGSRPVRILCDFDGTVTREDVTDAVLARLAAPAWLAVEEEWLAGSIGSRECLSRQVACLHASPQEVADVVDAIAVETGFRDFVTFCQAHGLDLTIVSDGFDLAIARVLARLGCAVPVRANRLVHHDSGRWSLATPHAHPACRVDAAHCKCHSGAPTTGLTIVIGDGRSDICVAEAADLVFAKDRPTGPSTLLRHCREHGLTHRAFSDFTDIVAALESLRSSAPLSCPEPTTP